MSLNSCIRSVNIKSCLVWGARRRGAAGHAGRAEPRLVDLPGGVAGVPPVTRLLRDASR